MADTFKELISKINVISKAADKKICQAEENTVAQDIVGMGPFGYIDSACTSKLVTEEDQKCLIDTGESLMKELRCPQGDITKATKKIGSIKRKRETQ